MRLVKGDDGKSFISYQVKFRTVWVISASNPRNPLHLSYTLKLWCHSYLILSECIGIGGRAFDPYQSTRFSLGTNINDIRSSPTRL